MSSDLSRGAASCQSGLSKGVPLYTIKLFHIHNLTMWSTKIGFELNSAQ